MMIAKKIGSERDLEVSSVSYVSTSTRRINSGRGIETGKFGMEGGMETKGGLESMGRGIESRGNLDTMGRGMESKKGFEGMGRGMESFVRRVESGREGLSGVESVVRRV